MSLIRTAILSGAGMLLTAGMALGQSVEVRQAELAVPFGTAAGKVVLVADRIVFVDEERLDASFAIARGDIKSFEEDGGTLTVTTRTPVRDRTGERSVVRLRVADATPLMRWYRTAGTGTMAASPAPATRAADTDANSFQARHDHRIGNCMGRLIITDDKLIFESIDNISDSRQWVYADIKEIEQDGPYKLQIEPFVGNTYNLELIGKGLDSRQYRMLVEKITTARVTS